MASTTLVVILTCLLLGACTSALTGPSSSTGVTARPLQLDDFAKNDVDQVAELHLAMVRAHLAAMMRKLYTRNPKQWRSHNKPSAEFLVQRVFRPTRVPDFVELDGRRGIDAIRLAFDDRYKGDRVLALLAGLTDMVHQSYGAKREFYFFDQLDPQKLYNSARNLETAAWLLRSRLDNSTSSPGRPMILSHSIGDEQTNLSFERLFGKMISLQDTIAQITAGRSNRTIRTVVHRVVGAVFLPI